MSDTKVSALSAATAAVGTQEIPVNEGGVSKKVTVDQIQAYVFVDGAFAPGSFTVLTGHFALMTGRLILTSTQRATLQGTARLRVC